MANRRDYYFRQKVTEAELDAGFAGLETADFFLSADHDLVGIVAGMGVAEKSGTPDLTVDVAGPGAAYSKQGERISFASLQNADLSQDDGAVSTAVSTPGNSRVVSLFITFDRLLSDPRIDGNAVTVYFQRDESFAFSVVAGAEAATGFEVPPAIDPNKILLADITLDFGQTQILNADIGVTRREDAYRLTGTLPVVAGTPVEAVTALLAGLNQHIDGIAYAHLAADLIYGGSGNWANGSPLSGSPADVESAIDQIVADLADIVGSGDSGGDRVGMAALAGTWADGGGFLAQSVRSAINKIVTELGATGGAARIGNAAAGDIAAVTVQAALNELDGDKLAKAGGTMTGDITLAGITDVKYSSLRSISIGAMGYPWVNPSNGWIPDNTAGQFGEWITDGAIFNLEIFFDLLPYIPHGGQFQAVTVIWEQTASFGTGADQMAARLYRHQLNLSTGARTVTEPVGFGALYGGGTGIKVNATLNPADFTIDKETTTLADTALVLKVEAAAGGVSRLLGIRLQYSDPGSLNGH